MILNILKCKNPAFYFILLFIVFFGPAIATADREDVSTVPTRENELKTIIIDSYYPYTYVNEDGAPDGFSVDLAKAVIQVMGMELKIQVDNWEHARTALENGEIDLLPMMAYSKERDKIFDFSVPHTVAYDALFTRVDSATINSVDGLLGKKVIVMKNDQAHDYLKSTLKFRPENLIMIDGLPEALRLLASGKGDAALMPKLVGLIINKDLNLTNLTKSPTVIEAYNRPFSFAVKEGNQLLLERLSQGLNIIKNSGQYGQIYEKWLGALEPKGLPLRTVLKYIIGIILAFILIGSVLLLWSFSLKKQVALRTRSLEKEITERQNAEKALRESEKNYREFVDNTPDLLYRTDIEGKITFISPSAQKLSGYTVEETIGKRMAAEVYIDPEERERFLTELQKTGYVEHFEAKLKRKDGSIWWASTNAHFLKDKDGNIQGVEGISRDITKLKEAEEEQKALKAQLQQAQKLESIGTLAGGIAHDFNNILSPIMIHSEMAMMELPPDNPVQHNLKEIFRASERARDMVKQILAFSRKSEGERAAIKITPILKDVLKMLRSSIPTTIDIQQNLEAESDTVFADPTQIHQILLNLGTNAAHAMREKGGTLKVSLVQENLDSEAAEQYHDLNPGSYLKLAVNDTGSGIDDETMQRIFEPYFTTKGPGEGTGMGLALVHGIVKSYGGDITVESEPGKGTTFNVYLPRIAVDVPSVEKSSAKLPRGTERILFVDDEKGAIDAIQPMLDNLGYKVTARTSSIEALEAFRNNSQEFNLVITDMTMPNMTGKELAKELMVIRPDIPIILCTGFSEQIDEKKAKEMGISAFVMKPIVMRDLANTIREVLDQGD